MVRSEIRLGAFVEGISEEATVRGLQFGLRAAAGGREPTGETIRARVVLKEEEVNGPLGPPPEYFERALQAPLWPCGAGSGAAVAAAGALAPVAGGFATGYTMPGWSVGTLVLVAGMAVFAPAAMGALRVAYLRIRAGRARRRRVRAALWIEPRIELALRAYDLAFLSGELVRGELGDNHVEQ